VDARVRADAHEHPRGRWAMSARTHTSVRADLGCIRADALVSTQTHTSIRADAVFTASADGKNPSAG
jgi:hypothetical protein